MVVIVSGGREANGDDCIRVGKELDAVHALTPIELLVEGGARGVDMCARHWASTHGVECKESPADWERHGRSAGHRRNAMMLGSHVGALVMAFPRGPSPGTRGMIGMAQRLGYVVRVVELEDL